MFKTILLATDGSRHANRALDAAVDIASHYDARLVIVHVLLHGRAPSHLKRMAEVEGMVERKPGSGSSADYVPRWMSAMARTADTKSHEYRQLLAVGEQILTRAEKSARKKGIRDVSPVIEEGDIVERLLETAKREQGDLIVLGTRGLSEVKGLMMGSVSHKVSQLAKCTCMIVK